MCHAAPNAKAYTFTLYLKRGGISKAPILYRYLKLRLEDWEKAELSGKHEIEQTP